MTPIGLIRTQAGLQVRIHGFVLSLSRVFISSPIIVIPAESNAGKGKGHAEVTHTQPFHWLSVQFRTKDGFAHLMDAYLAGPAFG